MIRIQFKILILLGFFLSIFAHANCTKVGNFLATDGTTAPIVFGKVNLTSLYLQPVGSLMGSAVVPPTSYTYGGANASTVFWECDLTDLPNIQFLVATNGDDRVGGYWDLGGLYDGLPNVYATYYKYVGLKQTMDGVVLTRYWKSLPVKNYQTVGSKIRIRLQDIPSLYAELYRVSRLAPQSGSGSAYCGTGIDNQITVGSYTCIQPNAYIQLKGPGLTSDNVGEDSNTNYRFWGVNNGIGYGMRTGNSLANQPTCVARNATPIVFSIR